MSAEELLDDDPSLVLDEHSDLYAMHRAFNATSSARRLFSEIHFHSPEDPDLTIGMGHWIRGNIANLFSRLRADDQLWQEITSKWASILGEEQWRQFHQETGVTEQNASGLAAGLDRVVCGAKPDPETVNERLVPWASKVGEEFNSSKHWFNAGWKRVSRLKPVAITQLNYWKDSVLEKGVADAHSRGIHTRGGVATIISARSSGIGATMFSPGARTASANNNGVSRHWSLVDVPDTAKPADSSAVSSAELLEDWRAVVAWQYYTLSKGRVRGRMKSLWKMYYEQSWGALSGSSLSEATKVPRHLASPMDARPFNFAVALRG
ncbi:hypothetical protein [Neorhizobium galegae]|uniref:hypothetical protein n=1 Tax=Neorhizobium galegae TaxID=399 RepID=UPI0021037AE8|nr:hypothetical protein [Neorhizobium galegae]MCQ1839245.1 hypothetical protein [Neorhizobium galegae]UIY31472.1 hypothetical protein LZK73_30875 [Neorhizobium galegae]